LIEAILAFVFGLLIGSFLNVCIYRWPRDLSVVKPRSHCPSCERMIAWYDNIPLASYVILGGRCRHCQARIPVRYPVVELATGVLFFYSVWTYGVTLQALKICVFTGMLIGLIFSDLEERILPDEFTIGGAIVGFIFAAFVPFRDDFSQMIFWALNLRPGQVAGSLAASAIGALGPALSLWFAGWVYYKLRGREGLGFGDVKLVAMVGAFLGLHGALLTLILGSVAGSILGYGYINLTRKDPSTYELPFGTFLGAAALIAGLTADKIALW
jgi:leader peptidase (prepilin peptidase)/N-methyltransferase